MEDGQHIARLLPGRVWAAAKRLSKKLRLRAIALDKRLWASHSKFCWQFLILSLCASLRRRLRAEGPGGAEDYGAGCSDRRICLLFDVTPHQIPHEEETLCGGEGGGGSCAVGPLGRDGPGGHFTPCHSMFVYRANSVTRSAVLGALWGEEGAMSSTLQKQPPGTLPERHHSHSMGCNQPPAQPRVRDQTSCSTNLICLAPHGIFQSVYGFSSEAK